MKQNVDSVLKTDWFYLPIVFEKVFATQYVLSFHCCEGFALLSSSAGMNYL